MSTLFADSIDSAYRRSITRSKVGIGVGGRSPFETAMDSVAALLADRRARLFSARTINALREQIARAERTINISDPRSSVIDTWAALLTVAEATDRDQELAAQQRLVVVLAEMLCSPVQMPLSYRQCYWEILQAYVLIFGRNPGHEDALTHIDQLFPLRMDVLHAAVWRGRIQPVHSTWGNADGNKRLSATDDLDRGRCLSPSRSGDAYDEAQYFGNSSDHWKRHTSHR